LGRQRTGSRIPHQHCRSAALSRLALPPPCLRDANNVKDEKQWHQKRWDQAQGQHCQGHHRRSARTQHTRRCAQAYRRYQVRHSEGLPQNEADAMLRMRQFPSHERCCRADGDIAVSGRQSKHRGQQVLRLQHYEYDAENSPYLHRRKSARIERQCKFSEISRRPKPKQ
jgi:hypothetical protein